MESNNSCDEFRGNYEALRDPSSLIDADLRKRLDNHVAECASCQRYKVQSDDIVAMSAQLPQFDVSEQITQNIMAAVGSERRTPAAGHYGLLIPVGVACIAAAITVLPVDSWEGLASTAVGVVGLVLLKMLISNVQPEESAV